MTQSPGPISPHQTGSPSRVIQGFFASGRPRIVQASSAPMAAVRPEPPAPIQNRPGSPPASLVPGSHATGALQPAQRPGQPPKPILPASVQPGAMQPATPLRTRTPQPILPQRATPAAVQPHAGDAFPLPANFTLKPRGSGQPLPEPVQKKMEAFFNTNFADVRVHVGPEAPSIGALAFTHGTDLYFAPGQYNPQSTQGQQLLGHELTHVLQQRAGRVRNPLGSGVAVVQDPALEAEAERMGLRAASATPPIQAKPAGTGPVVATLQAADLRPKMVAANGVILPARSLDQGSVQRKPGPILPGKSRAAGHGNSSAIFPSGAVQMMDSRSTQSTTEGQLNPDYLNMARNLLAWMHYIQATPHLYSDYLISKTNIDLACGVAEALQLTTSVSSQQYKEAYREITKLIGPNFNDLMAKAKVARKIENRKLGFNEETGNIAKQFSTCFGKMPEGVEKIAKKDPNEQSIFMFHMTSWKNLQLIIVNGLDPAFGGKPGGSCGITTNQSLKSESEKTTKGKLAATPSNEVTAVYIHQRIGWADVVPTTPIGNYEVLLRFKSEKGRKGKDQWVDDPVHHGAFHTIKKINPDDIECLMPNGWVPIKNIDRVELAAMIDPMTKESMELTVKAQSVVGLAFEGSEFKQNVCAFANDHLPSGALPWTDPQKLFFDLRKRENTTVLLISEGIFITFTGTTGHPIKEPENWLFVFFLNEEQLQSLKDLGGFLLKYKPQIDRYNVKIKEPGLGIS